MVTIYFLTLFVIFRTESSTTRLNEVKNLGNIHVYVIEILPPFGRLNDK